MLVAEDNQVNQFAATQLLQRCLAAGMDDCLSKPMRMAAVAALWDRLPAQVVKLHSRTADDVEIKGSSATVGATRLSLLFDTMCRIASGRSTAVADEVMAQILSTISETGAVIDAFIEELRLAQPDACVSDCDPAAEPGYGAAGGSSFGA